MEPTSLLKIQGPDGQQWTFRLTQNLDRVTVGRSGPDNRDIQLGSDASKLISRQHCTFELRNTKWWLIQDGRNCSRLRRKTGRPEENIEIHQHQEVLLADGDIVRIREREHCCWKIQFCDQQTTQSASTMSLRYEKQSKKLFLRKGGVEHEINRLTPHERKLVDFMLVQRQPGTLCRYEEIIAAVWEGDPTTHDSLRKLISQLRGKLKELAGEAHFLVSHASQGYSFYTELLD